MKMDICKWCEKRVWFWQRKTEVYSKHRWSYYHDICAIYQQMSILLKMIVEMRTDIPPTQKETDEKGYAGWCLSGYEFYRMEGQTHEEARDGAFIVKEPFIMNISGAKVVDGAKVVEEYFTGTDMEKQEINLLHNPEISTLEIKKCVDGKWIELQHPKDYLYICADNLESGYTIIKKILIKEKIPKTPENNICVVYKTSMIF